MAEPMKHYWNFFKSVLPEEVSRAYVDFELINGPTKLAMAKTIAKIQTDAKQNFIRDLGNLYGVTLMVEAGVEIKETELSKPVE